MIDPLDLFERMSEDTQIRIFEHMINSFPTSGEGIKGGRRDKLSDDKINEILELGRLGNLSHAEIARRTGVSSHSVRRYLNGAGIKTETSKSSVREISKEEAEKILNEVIPETI